ncbi:MAG: hypothetical protein ABIE70_02425 [bacterium]
MKIFKLFKKGARAAAGQKGKEAKGAFEWPQGIRVAVFGQANSGKTVYFTVLNEECKVSRRLQISVTDHLTAGEFLTNFRALWGIGTTSTVGTIVDLKEDRKFPDPTKNEKILQFTAILDQDEKIPVVTCDYNGQAASISEPHEFREKFFDFVTGADGILFFFDPKVLGAVVQCQAHVASFVNVLEKLVPLSQRLPVPVCLVVTKADVLPGFTGEQQTVLVAPEDESTLAEGFEVFLEKVLSSNRIASDSVWAGTVREVLVKLKEFLKVVVGRTLDFQIFFVSATGQPPEKIGSDVGRSVYTPPDKIQPVGVRRPFYWALNSILRARRIHKIRRITRLVVIISLAWTALYSLPFVYHFAWQLPRLERLEDNMLGNRARYDVPPAESKNVLWALNAYANSRPVKFFFDRFIVPAQQIKQQYDKRQMGEALAELDKRIGQLKMLVSDQTLWPTVNPLDSSLNLLDIHNGLEAGLKTYQQGDSTSELFRRSGRSLVYWELLKQAFVKRADSAAWNRIATQVSNNRQLYATELSPAEEALMETLMQTIQGSQTRKAKTESAAKAGDEFSGVVRQITDSEDPQYLLGKAARDLRRIRGDLANDQSRVSDVGKIDSYLRQAKYFDKTRTYHYSVDYAPEGHHIHLSVVAKGDAESWPGGQILPGRPQSIEWKSGDAIYVALDPNNHDGQGETFGKESTVRKKLEGDFAIFEMQGEIVFPSGDRISIVFGTDSDPREKLPNFEE